MSGGFGVQLLRAGIAVAVWRALLPPPGCVGVAVRVPSCALGGLRGCLLLGRRRGVVDDLPDACRLASLPAQKLIGRVRREAAHLRLAEVLFFGEVPIMIHDRQ